VARLREERERELRVLHDSRAGALEDSLQDVTLKFTRLREDFRYNLTVRGSWSLHTKPTHFSLPPLAHMAFVEPTPPPPPHYDLHTSLTMCPLICSGMLVTMHAPWGKPVFRHPRAALRFGVAFFFFLTTA
jgi:hypothetical protein